MRLIALGALALAALLLLPNAFALESAAVSGPMSISVVSTDSAAIRLTPGTGAGNPAQNAYLSGGVLALDFRRGTIPGTVYGFPYAGNRVPPNRFRYRGLFHVTNNSGVARCIRVYVPGGGVADLAGIYVRQPGEAGSGLQVAGSGGVATGACEPVGAGGTVQVDFWWEVVSSRSNTVSFVVAVRSD